MFCKKGWMGDRGIRATLAMVAMFFFLAGTASAAGSQGAPPATIQSVIYPAPEAASDHRYDYYVELLRMALDRTVNHYGPYAMKPSDKAMTESRYLQELTNKTGRVNVIWSSTSSEREAAFIPIRISILKDLLGYRIALIPKDLQVEVNRIQTLDDLRTLKLGQGLGWGDTAIFKSNGLTVSEFVYTDLFRMTAGKSVDFFPRGVTEIFKEFEANRAANPNLAIEQNLVIYYPFPYYYFTSRSEARLAERIEKGLELMLKDGSFDNVFFRFNKQAIQKANLKHRRMIQLENPFLPKDTPVGSGKLLGR